MGGVYYDNQSVMATPPSLANQTVAFLSSFYDIIITSAESPHLHEHVDSVQYHVRPRVPVVGRAEVTASYAWGHCTIFQSNADETFLV